MLHIFKLKTMSTKNILILGTLLFASVSLFAQGKKDNKKEGKENEKKETKMSAKEEKEQKAWMAYMTPGEMHKMLVNSKGDWHENLTFWMAPGGEPMQAESDCTNKMILGDRYQESIHTGMMMGMPFEGRGTIGYDNAKKTFQSTWVDNMGTGIMYLEGKYKEGSKTITLKGTAVDPMTGKTENVRHTLKFIDDKTQLMEMYMTKDGKEFKNMEIKFTKKS